MSKYPQNICLFCNRSNSFHTTIADVSEPMRKFVKLLQRFIQSEDNDIAINVDQLLENQFSKWVNFCEECILVIDKFCDFYHKLKCLEMQLEGKLDGLVEVIKLGGKVPSRALHLDKVLEHKFKNDKSKISKTRNLLKTLRQSIIQNGQRRLNLSTPRVMLERKPFSNTGHIIEHVNLLNDDVQSICSNLDKECHESLNKDDHISNPFASNYKVSFEMITEKEIVAHDKYDRIGNGSESVQYTTNKTRNDDVLQSATTTNLLEPEDLPPDINDEDESLNTDFEIAEVEQESFTSEILGESGTLKIEQAVLLPEISQTPVQLQVISPAAPSSLIVENLGLKNLSNAKTSSNVISRVPINSEIDPVEISEIPEVGSPIQACQEISLANIEHLDQEETDTFATSFSKQRYNLRKKRKLKFAEESSSDDDVRDDNSRKKYRSRHYTSSETSSDLDDLDGRERLKNRSRHSCSSETTSESEETDNDMKPLQQTMVAKMYNTSLTIAKSSKVKRKRKRPLNSKEPLAFRVFGNAKATKQDEPENNDKDLNTLPTGLSGKSESEKEKGKLFKCFSDSCKKQFHNEHIYQNHRKLHENGEFQCSFCDIKETNLVKLSTHEYKTHTPEQKQKTDLKERRFQGHARTCPRCSLKFDSVLNYQEHFSFVHFKIGEDPNNLNAKTKFRYKHIKGKRLKAVSEEINGIKGYRCQTCKILFPNKTKLSRHFHESHKLKEDPTPIIKHDIPNSNTEPSKSDKNFKCYFCELTFEHAPDLAIHETEHATVVFTQPRGKKQQGAERMKFQCPRCPYKYNSRTIYIRHHLVNHLNILPDGCTMCSGGTTCIPNSKEHFDRFHNKNLLDDQSQISECNECSAYFLKPFQLFLHKQKLHQGNVHKCQFCEKICPQKSGLKSHLYNVHKYSDEDPKLPFGCDSTGCKKRCSTLGELDLHKIFHRSTTACKQRKQGESTTCEECGKVCKSKVALSAHKHNVHSKHKFVCQECGKPFKTKHLLNAHMLYHQSPDEWEFQCTECGKKCATKEKLDQHMRTHTKEKPFVCQLCGEQYAHRHNWRNHLKTKHGDEEGAQEDINGIINKAQGASFISRKGSKKGDCIIAGKSTKTSP